MILTAIVPGGDGRLFSVESEGEQFGVMFDKELRARNDTWQIFDVDEILVVQRGRTRFLYRGKELDLTERVFATTQISLCRARERKLANIHYILSELQLPILNQTFTASPELELNKAVMQALAADLNIPTVASMSVEPYLAPEDLLSTAIDLGFAFPLLLKPNRMSNGVGILRCDGPSDFVEKARLVQMLKVDYLLQDFVPHSGDLRIFLSRDSLFGHKYRGPRENDFRCGGGEYRQVEIPEQVQEWSLRIAERCGADYITIDWLVTDTGFEFHEMCSSLGSFIGVPEASRTRIARAILDIARAKLASSKQR